jgi:hypothetical protein
LRADGDDARHSKSNCHQRALQLPVNIVTKHRHFDQESPSFCGILRLLGYQVSLAHDSGFGMPSF